MRHPGKPGRRARTRRRWLYVGSAPLIAVLLAAVSGASGFASSAAAATRSAATLPVTTIGYALSGPANDGGYYQNQAQKIVQLGHQRGIKVIIAQNADPNSATVFEDLARQGAQVVIADGSEFTPAMLTFSKNPAFQSTLPLMISGDPPVAPTFATAGGNELQAHFMGGVAAGLLLQQHGKTGACDVAGPNIAFVKNAAAAMQQGLHYVNPNYQFHVTFTGDFNNTALAASASKALIAQGCYVLYPYPWRRDSGGPERGDQGERSRRCDLVQPVRHAADRDEHSVQPVVLPAERRPGAGNGPDPPGTALAAVLRGVRRRDRRGDMQPHRAPDAGTQPGPAEARFGSDQRAGPDPQRHPGLSRDTRGLNGG